MHLFLAPSLKMIKPEQQHTVSNQVSGFDTQAWFGQCVERIYYIYKMDKALVGFECMALYSVFFHLIC